MTPSAEWPATPADEVRDRLLVATGLAKRYGQVTALREVDFHLSAGEVVAVCGDNGAGKSTFISILAGVVEPDDGAIHLAGRRVWMSSPLRAQELGIATVFQDLALVEQRDVAANLFLGREPVRWGVVVDRRRMLKESAEVIDRLKVKLPSARTLVGELSGGQRQAVAVARAILRGSRVLLMDEPTAALGVRESRRVLELIGELRAEGQGIVVVTHNLDSAFEIADRIVVFRLGRKVADREAGALRREQLVSLLVSGEPIPLP